MHPYAPLLQDRPPRALPHDDRHRPTRFQRPSHKYERRQRLQKKFEKASNGLISMSLEKILKNFKLTTKFHDYGDFGQHKAPCQGFSDDDDDFYDDDVLRECCQRASEGALEAL